MLTYILKIKKNFIAKNYLSQGLNLESPYLSGADVLSNSFISQNCLYFRNG